MQFYAKGYTYKRFDNFVFSQYVRGKDVENISTVFNIFSQWKFDKALSLILVCKSKVSKCKVNTGPISIIIFVC